MLERDLPCLNETYAWIVEPRGELNERRGREVCIGIEDKQQITRVPSRKTVVPTTRPKVFTECMIGHLKSIGAFIVQRGHISRRETWILSVVPQGPLNLTQET